MKTVFPEPNKGGYFGKVHTSVFPTYKNNCWSKSGPGPALGVGETHPLLRPNFFEDLKLK
ncbi:hypothetical protein HanIR_Chr14g0712591 [Helianthus annuus]|nr:hypothetical protein HanIR_Chr14g0712591 [Helianthus annuus]